MIDYSIKKPHALCGHFIKINNETEYQEVKAIAEGCGFEVKDKFSLKNYHFENAMTVRWYGSDLTIGQELTLSELRQLAELSKIELPCEMEVWDYDDNVHKKLVIDFYKGQPVVNCDLFETHYTYKHYRLPNPNAVEIEFDTKEGPAYWLKISENDPTADDLLPPDYVEAPEYVREGEGNHIAEVGKMVDNEFLEWLEGEMERQIKNHDANSLIISNTLLEVHEKYRETHGN